MTTALPLFKRLLGDTFERLPLAVKILHGDSSDRVYTGRCDIERGNSRLAAVCAALVSLPAQGCDLPVTVSLLRDRAGETWVRNFAGKIMRSRLTPRDGNLQEALGPVRFIFALRADAQAIDWRLVGVKIIAVPLPLTWFKGVTARGSSRGGKYTFDVRAELPYIGLLVHYRGWLEVDPAVCAD